MPHGDIQNGVASIPHVHYFYPVYSITHCVIVWHFHDSKFLPKSLHKIAWSDTWDNLCYWIWMNKEWETVQSISIWKWKVESKYLLLWTVFASFFWEVFFNQRKTIKSLILHRQSDSRGIIKPKKVCRNYRNIHKW